MLCRNCGKGLIGTPEICPNCGAKVAITKYPISIEVERSERLSRLTTFFRFFMVIPQTIVLGLLGIAAAVVVFISWWAILFIGRYPKWAFDFVSGYFRWSARVGGYSIFLTDKYPPFSFQ